MLPDSACGATNPPYKNAADFVRHYLSCKSESPTNTAAMFVLPLWPNAPWESLVSHMQLVHTYPARYDLFTRPSRTDPTQRERVGPAPWPVCVYYDPPSEDVVNVDRQLSNALATTSSSSTGPPLPFAPSPPQPLPSSSAPSATSSAGDDPTVIGNVSCDEQTCDNKCPKVYVTSALAPGSSSAPDTSQQLIVLHGTLHGKPCKVLVDCGASREFVSLKFVAKHRVPV